MSRHDVFSGRVMFDHLPKTAGQAVNAWLVEQLGAGCVIPNVDGNHRDTIRQYGGRYSILSGHIEFRPAEGLDPRYRYLTVVREPIERALSWLHYLIHNNEHPHLDGMVELARRFLESDGRELAPALKPYISEFYVNHFCLIIGSDDDTDEQKLDDALAAIRQYDVVGLHTDMPDFLAETAALIGLPPPTAELARVNVTRVRPPADAISAALRERIITLNRLDLRFFAEVEQWLSARRLDPAAARAAVPTVQLRKYAPPANRMMCKPDIVVSPVSLRGGTDVAFGQILNFEVDFFLTRDVSNLNAGIHVFDEGGCLAFGTSSVLKGRASGILRSGSHRVGYKLRATLPAGKYAVGFAFVEGVRDGWRELAWYDSLCEFTVVHPANKRSIGYADLPAAVKLATTGVVTPKSAVVRPKGNISISKPPETTMACGQTVNIAVDICNRGTQAWRGDRFRPVNASYRWLNASGDDSGIEGLRTPTPASGVLPGQTVLLEMSIQAPPQPGSYILKLTLVQEHVAWFDGMEFESARLPINVTL